MTKQLNPTISAQNGEMEEEILAKQMFDKQGWTQQNIVFFNNIKDVLKTGINVSPKKQIQLNNCVIHKDGTNCNLISFMMC
jgi:hypothetical protein